MKTVIKLLLTLVVLGVGAWGGWQIYQKLNAPKKVVERAKDKRAVPVEAAAVREGTIRDIRTFTGTLEARARSTVAPKIAGRLEKLHVDIGSTVTRGQPVAELDDDEYVQQVEQARAELLVAQANQTQADFAMAAALKEFDRVKTLFDRKIASESELDIARVEHEAQKAKAAVAAAVVTQREAALKGSEIRRQYTRVVAQWEGGADERVVGERYVEAGDTLAANAPIVSVLDIEKVIAVIQITEREYARLHETQTATIAVDAFPTRTWTGKVTRMAPVFREGSRQARVEITVDNPRLLLKPGMYARVTIELAKKDNARIVPVEALVRREGGTGVFVVNPDGKTVAWRLVEVGIQQGNQVQVTGEGIEGRVVTLGQQLIDDGALILVPRTAPEPKVTPVPTPAATPAANEGEAGS